MRKPIVPFLVLSLLISAVSWGSSAPVFDKKLSKEEKIKRCADWAKKEVAHLSVRNASDAKAKNTAFKKPAEECSLANHIDPSWMYSFKI